MKANVNTDRLVPVEIAGTTYFMNCSLNTFKRFAKELELLSSDETPSEDAMQIVLEVVAHMIQQGKKYKQLRYGEDAPDVDADGLGTLCSGAEVEMLIEKLNEAFEAAGVRNVEVLEEKAKNGKAAQGKKA